MTVAWPRPEFPPEIRLPALGHLPPLTHLFDADSVWAIRAALGARRPLLVRGEPGTGKSQLARAAALALRRPLVSEVVTARSEPQDLHFRFDAVARLGQAQVLAISAQSTAGAAGNRGIASSGLAALDERLFVQPGPLWWVLDWEGAQRQHELASVKAARPREPEGSWGWRPEQGTVLLIDEIDKADADLPNGLLESLGNGEFHVPYLPEAVKGSPSHAAPLVIITTNEERELPAAFVRRCLVLQMELPSGELLAPFLRERGRAHFADRCSEEVYTAAATQLVSHRATAEKEGWPRPGQAEYLDLLRAVLEVAGEDVKRQGEVLTAIQRFALRKNPPALP